MPSLSDVRQLIALYGVLPLGEWVLLPAFPLSHTALLPLSLSCDQMIQTRRHLETTPRSQSHGQIWGSVASQSEEHDMENAAVAVYWVTKRCGMKRLQGAKHRWIKYIVCGKRSTDEHPGNSSVGHINFSGPVLIELCVCMCVFCIIQCMPSWTVSDPGRAYSTGLGLLSLSPERALYWCPVSRHPLPHCPHPSSKNPAIVPLQSSFEFANKMICLHSLNNDSSNRIISL